MCLKQQKTILQITIDRCYKPFPNGWFIIVLTTLPSIWKKIEFFLTQNTEVSVIFSDHIRHDGDNNHINSNKNTV